LRKGLQSILKNQFEKLAPFFYKSPGNTNWIMVWYGKVIKSQGVFMKKLLSLFAVLVFSFCAYGFEEYLKVKDFEGIRGSWSKGDGDIVKFAREGDLAERLKVKAGEKIWGEFFVYVLAQGARSEKAHVIRVDFGGGKVSIIIPYSPKPDLQWFKAKTPLRTTVGGNDLELSVSENSSEFRVDSLFITTDSAKTPKGYKSVKAVKGGLAEGLTFYHNFDDTTEPLFSLGSKFSKGKFNFTKGLAGKSSKSSIK